MGSIAARAADTWYFSSISTAAIQSDLAVDSTGKPWVSYIRQGACPQVVVAQWTVDRWTAETVDPLCLPTTNAPVPIALTPSGEPSVVYWRLATGELRVARRAAGVWTLENAPLKASEYNLDYAVDAAGHDHVFYVANSTSFSRIVTYAKKSAGVWQTAFIRGSSTSNVTLAGFDVDSAGDAYLAYNLENFPTTHYIMGKKSTGAFAVLFSSVANQPGGHLAVGPDDRAQFPARPSSALLRLGRFPPLEFLPLPNLSVSRFAVDMASRAHLLSVFSSGGATTFQMITVDGTAVSTQSDPAVTGLPSMTPRVLKIGEEERPYVLGGQSPVGAQLGARLAAVPAIAAVARTTTSITWGWTPSTATALVEGFRVRRFGDNADLSGLLAPAAGSWTESGLGLNAPSTVYLEAYHPGVAARSSTATAQTATFAPAAIELTRLVSGGLTASWSAAGNPPSIDYAVTLLSAGGLSNLQVTNNPSYNFPVFSPSEPHLVTVDALSDDGARFPMSSTTAFSWDGQSVRMGFALPASGLTLEAEVSQGPGAPHRAFAASDAENFPSHANALVPVVPTGQAFNLAATGPGLAGQTARVEVGYPAARFDAYSGASLLLSRYDADRDAWLLMATTHDPGARRISARIDRFGVFQVMARFGQPEGLGLTSIYPNPFRPGAGATLTVREIPAGARVRVVSAGGRTIRTLTAGNAGSLEWDGVDDSGGLVKSGVYVIRVDGAGGEKDLRLVVER